MENRFNHSSSGDQGLLRHRSWLAYLPVILMFGVFSVSAPVQIWRARSREAARATNRRHYRGQGYRDFLVGIHPELTDYFGNELKDGVPATKAIVVPQGLSADPSGNLYITDGNDGKRILKVGRGGAIIRVAGTGFAGFFGDGGPATRAQLNGATRLAIDSVGNLYIADTGNNRIRKVDRQGIITTIAGNGRVEASGRSGFSGDGGPAIAAQLSGPDGVAVDGKGNLFIADRDNCRVRKVDPNGVISTIAGIGPLNIMNNGHIRFGYSGDGGLATHAALCCPAGLAVDPAGDLYIADAKNCRVRKVSPSGIITTVAGIGRMGPDKHGKPYSISGDGGPAVRATLNVPSDVALDQKGNVYIADTNNHRIRMVDRSGIIRTIAGPEGADSSGFGRSTPVGAGADSSISLSTREARIVTHETPVPTVPIDPIERSLRPDNIIVAPGGTVYLSDSEDMRVMKIRSSGKVSTVAGLGWAESIQR